MRPIRERVNAALVRLNGLFEKMHEPDWKGGRPSNAPEKLVRAMLLQAFYSIRSERLLMEQVQYNLLFRWFIGLSMDDKVWVPTVFTRNRERLIGHGVVVTQSKPSLCGFWQDCQQYGLYHLSEQAQLIEQGVGCAKQIGRIRQVMVRGLAKVDQVFVLNMAAYNLVRMQTLGKLRLEAAPMS